jgi:hypothetical protein
MVFHHTSSTVQRKSSLVDATRSDANTGEYNASLPLHHALFHLSNSGVLENPKLAQQPAVTQPLSYTTASQ